MKLTQGCHSFLGCRHLRMSPKVVFNFLCVTTNCAESLDFFSYRCGNKNMSWKPQMGRQVREIRQILTFLLRAMSKTKEIFGQMCFILKKKAFSDCIFLHFMIQENILVRRFRKQELIKVGSLLHAFFANGMQDRKIIKHILQKKEIAWKVGTK